MVWQMYPNTQDYFPLRSEKIIICINEHVHVERQILALATSADPDQSVHLRSLIRIFADRI